MVVVVITVVATLLTQVGPLVIARGFLLVLLAKFVARLVTLPFGAGIGCMSHIMRTLPLLRWPLRLHTRWIQIGTLIPVQQTTLPVTSTA
jgi:hypothetical protein